MAGYFTDIRFETEDIDPSWAGMITLGDIVLVSNKCRIMCADKFKIMALMKAEIGCKRNIAEKCVGF